MNPHVKKRNLAFIFFNALLVIIVVAASLIPCLFPCIIPCADYNAAGIACQVLTALVCCIASMIGISFSIQDSTFFGIKIKELRELRIGKHYSLQSIMIISVLIVAVNLLFYICGFVYTSYGLSISAVLFCLYIIRQEIPLMAKKEEAALQILKSRILANTDAADVHATEFDKALKYLIIHKNLKTTYEKLNYGATDKNGNKRILTKLLDLQTNLASELNTIDDKQRLAETVDALSENLIDIISFSFDLTELFDGETSNYTHYVTRTLFWLNEHPTGKNVSSRIVRRALSSLDYACTDTGKKAKKDFLFAVLLSVIPYSVSRGDFSFLHAVQEYYSEKTYILSKENNSTLLFSLLSLYLYYICELEQSIPAEIKNKIKENVCSNNQIIDGRVIYSWTHLFHQFSGYAHVNYSEFMRIFKNNEHLMEYMLLNAGAHWVIMDEDLAFQWYATNMLNRNDNSFEDFSVTFGKDLDRNTIYKLKKLYDDCYKEGNRFFIPDYMTKMLAFYGVNNILNLFLIVDNNDHTLFNYLTAIKAQDIRDETEKLKEMDETALAERIKKAVSEAISKEWGRDETLEISSERKYLSVLIEKADAVNFDEVLIDHFVWSTVYSFRSLLSTQKIVKNAEFDEKIRALLKEDIKAVSANGVFMVPHYLKDAELQNQYMEKVSSVEKYHSSILPHTSFVLQNGFSFNYQVDSVTVEKLSEEQINEQVEKHKRADGQYVYEGTFMNREDVYSVVKAKAIIITLSARYGLHAPENGIVEVDLFPKQDSESE